MDHTAGIAHLRHEYGLFQAAVAAAAPDAVVPTCPDWTATDLQTHVTTVYAHKVACIRTGAEPEPWPPVGGVGTLDRAWAELIEELTTRPPEHPAHTWFPPDQTVGFWIRRMAHETAIHRVDAELAAGIAPGPVDPELAIDGIDEVLRVSVEFASESWPEDFADVLAGADRRPVLVDAGSRAWRVTAGRERILVADPDPGDAADARVTGEPGLIYRWLWGRGGDVKLLGDSALTTQLTTLMVPALQ
jgi:uncharacterized protein (TIGR03083 family)